MSTDKPAGFEHWDEQELEDLVNRFVRTFHRSPDYHDLQRFRRGRASLALRLPLQSRRTIASMIASM